MRESSKGRIRIDESLADIGYSDPVTDIVLPLTVCVIPDDATGKVQYTTSPEASIADDTAIWRDWAAGEVDETTETVFDAPITGLRLAYTGGSGSLTWEVAAG